jgi:hypothetical protein
MQAESISLIGGTALSLVFSYIPGANSRFNKLDGNGKRLVMLGLLFLVSAVVFGLSCTSFAVDLGITVTCDQGGAIGLITQFIIAIIANQATFTISPQRNAKEAIRS